MANVLTLMLKLFRPGVATIVRTIYKRLSLEEVHAQADRVMAQLREHFPQGAEMLAHALTDILAFSALPVSHCQKFWSNNPLERLAEGIRRRRACPGRERVGYLPQPSREPASGGRGAG